MRNFFVLFLFFSLFAKSQVTVYSENFGSTPVFTSVSTYTGYQHYGEFTYSGNASVRNTLPSTGYAGASGGANVFFTSVIGTNLTITGLNTYCYIYAFLSVGIWKSTVASNGSEFLIEYSDNGGPWTQMSFTLPTGNGSAIWRNITLAQDLPITTNLSIRFTQTSNAGIQFRIDDINIAGIQNATDTFISNCTGFFYNGTLYNQDSLYIFTETDYKGCDSLVRVEYMYDPADPTCILPIELSSFSGKQSNDVIILTWTTASEFNSSHFEIETYINNSWEQIGKVEASGFSLVTQEYNYQYLFGGIFRLKMVDLDGTYKYSKAIRVKYQPESNVPVKYFNILGQEIETPDYILNRKQ